MSYNRNVVEDALFQIKNLEETLQENAKGILQSTMSEEIRQLVKESLREQEGVTNTGNTPNQGVEDDMPEDDDMPVDDEEMDDEDMEMDDQGVEMDDEDMEMDDEDMEMDDEDMPEEDPEDEAIDMTDATDQEVLRVFKAMGDQDGIIVKKEGENIHLKDGEDEYMIRLRESQMDYSDNSTSSIYEITLDDVDDEYSGPFPKKRGDFRETAFDDVMEYDEMKEYGSEYADYEEYGKSLGKIPREMKEYGSEFEDYKRYGQSLGMIPKDEMKEYGSEFEDYKRYGQSLGMIPKDEMEEDTVYEIDMSQYLKEIDDDELMEYSDDEMMEYSDDEMMEYSDDEMMEYSDDYMMESKRSKKSIKQKGVGIGKGPKFSYDKKPNMNGGFNEKRKEAFGKGIKAMGTGKAKFQYKDGTNLDGRMSKVKKSETKEASRTYGNGSKNGSRGLRKARLNNRNYEYNPFKLSESTSSEEVYLLKERNEEYRKALDVFRTKLNEVAIFNSNLAYATRLFTEHSTTKQEKINILRRFDNVETLKESKNLYRTIKNELNSNGSYTEQRINESIERTVNKTAETGSSVNLIESKTYENPQFLRMKDLMTKIK